MLQMRDEFYFSKEDGKTKRMKWKSIQECMKYCTLEEIRYNDIINEWVLYFRNNKNERITIWWTKKIPKCVAIKYTTFIVK